MNSWVRPLLWFPWALRLFLEDFLRRHWRRRHLIALARTLRLFFCLIHSGLRNHHYLIFVFCHLHIGIRNVFRIVREEDSWPRSCMFTYTIRDFLVARVNTLNRRNCHFRHAQSFRNIRSNCHFIKHDLVADEFNFFVFVFYDVDIIIIEIWLIDILNGLFLLMKHFFKIFVRGSIRNQRIKLIVSIFGVRINFEDLWRWSVHVDVVKLCIYGTWRSLNRKLGILLTTQCCFSIFGGNFDQVFLISIVLERWVLATLIYLPPVCILCRSNFFSRINLHGSLRSPMLIFRHINGLFIDLPRHSWVRAKIFVTTIIRLDCVKLSTFYFWQRWSFNYVWLDFGQEPLTRSLFSLVSTLINSLKSFKTW